MTADKESHSQGVAELARGGRTNFAGFLLRLGARLPFLLLAARLYGAEDLGRFAYATMVVELVAAIATFGMKRGIAAEMVRGNYSEVDTLADCLLLGLFFSVVGGGILFLFPGLMLPAGTALGPERWLALIVPAIALSDIALAGLAFRHRIDFTVRARSVIEPWVLIAVAIGLSFTALRPDGLLIAYGVSLILASLASLRYAVQLFGLPYGWRPTPARLWRIATRNLPLAGADLVEWATRRLDIFLLGRFAGADVVGIYYVAQQVATLAGKIRVSFDPILSPMLASAIEAGKPDEAARHIRQVGFWVLALQLPVVLALALAGEGVLGLFGPEFAIGAIVLALLLSVEVAAAASSIFEMGLVYARPHSNLLVGLSGLVLQGGLSLALIPHFGGSGAAAALLLSIIAVGLVRHYLLAGSLGASILFWRRSVLGAGLAAFAIGYASRMLPEFWHMLLGIPAVLLVFGFVIWRFGFGPADRALFLRK